MARIALVLAIVALLVGSVAYWRSGGSHDVAVARQEIHTAINSLQAKQQELLDSVSATMRDVYERSQERMKRFGETISQTRQQAGEALTKQLDRASAQLAAIQDRVAKGLASLKESTIATARSTQEALMRRVNRMEARLSILQARWKIDSAIDRAEDRDFEAAEQRLEQAVALIKEARDILGSDREYQEKLNAVRDSLQAAVSAVKAKAADTRSHIDRVVTETDALVSQLEADEQKAEDAAAAKESAA